MRSRNAKPQVPNTDLVRRRGASRFLSDARDGLKWAGLLKAQIVYNYKSKKKAQFEIYLFDFIVIINLLLLSSLLMLRTLSMLSEIFL